MQSSNTPPAKAVVADIGGTNARFAVADLASLELVEMRHFLCSDHPTLAHATRAYLDALPEPPAYAAIAVAAPVAGDEIRLTNSPWSFARAELCRDSGLAGVLVLNDFQALALSLPHLQASELAQIGGGEAAPHAPKVVVGPGTGIGVGGLVWSGRDWVTVASEGGHILLAAQDQSEFAVIERLRTGRERVSVERALSGPGLSDLYQAVAALRAEVAPALAPGGLSFMRQSNRSVLLFRGLGLRIGREVVLVGLAREIRRALHFARLGPIRGVHHGALFHLRDF